MRDKRELARVWAEEKPSIRIGKGGVDAGLVAEVKRLLKKKRIIKVRVLRSALAANEVDKLVAELAAQTSCEVCGRRGLVFVLARK
ncbi:MAG: YhbY family RNA-binding protein [Promethearchaeota archaeon]